MNTRGVITTLTISIMWIQVDETVNKFSGAQIWWVRKIEFLQIARLHCNYLSCSSLWKEGSISFIHLDEVLTILYNVNTSHCKRNDQMIFSYVNLDYHPSKHFCYYAIKLKWRRWYTMGLKWAQLVGPLTLRRKWLL